MNLSREQVKKIAELARLGLNESEIDKFSTQLKVILENVDVLSEVNTDDVEPTFQVTGLQNVLNEDVVKTSEERFGATSDELLNCSPLTVEARQILVKSVF